MSALEFHAEKLVTQYPNLSTPALVGLLSARSSTASYEFREVLAAVNRARYRPREG